MVFGFGTEIVLLLLCSITQATLVSIQDLLSEVSKGQYKQDQSYFPNSSFPPVTVSGSMDYDVATSQGKLLFK